MYNPDQSRHIPAIVYQIIFACSNCQMSLCSGNQPTIELRRYIQDNIGLGAVSIRKTVLPGMAIPMLKIRRPTGRLIFNMGIPIPGKTVFYIETGPWLVLCSVLFIAGWCCHVGEMSLNIVFEMLMQKAQPTLSI